MDLLIFGLVMLGLFVSGPNSTPVSISSPKQLLEKLTLVLGETPIDPKTKKPSASPDCAAGIRRGAPGHLHLPRMEEGGEAQADGGFAAETPGCGWVYSRQLLAAWGGDGADDVF